MPYGMGGSVPSRRHGDRRILWGLFVHEMDSDFLEEGSVGVGKPDLP
jgi:hypothetical protein